MTALANTSEEDCTPMQTTIAQLSFTGSPPASCRVCHRPLTNPVSIAAGIGPVCAGGHQSAETPVADEDRCDLPFDPKTMDITCRRDGARPGIRHFNIAQRHKHHSPTGMEWGYGGSGPADFALNILALFLPLQRVPEPADDAPLEAWVAYVESLPASLWDGSEVSPQAWDLHQSFKWAFVATLPEAGGVITGAAVRAWIAEQLAGSEVPA